MPRAYRISPKFVPTAAALAALLALSACSSPADSAEVRVQTPAPVPPPALMARAGVALDVDTGALLYSKEPDLVIPPASLTKLMTLHLAWRALEEGAASVDDLVPISLRAWARNQPPGSSLMFLEPGQQVTLFELMKGLALPSGNDAAVAVAEFLGGSVGAFVEKMNAEAAKLGMTSTRFVDPSGIGARNATTASDLARLCRTYVLAHPAAPRALHALTTFTYPRPENLPPAYRGSRPTLSRPNHNELLGRLDGILGLKTGYIDESGYNMALYAERGAMRVVGVILGGTGDNAREGGLNRSIDSASLMSYAFYAWTTVPVELPAQPAVRVYGARRGRAPVAWDRPAITVASADASHVSARREYREDLRAPLARGARVGEIVISVRGREEMRAPMVAAEDASRGSFVRLGWDALALAVHSRVAR
jgi:serine-type D-Ala-D-Ala carboxypeptidase (penicillin-binding protein 5/6)